MSAFMVSAANIDALVAGGESLGPGEFTWYAPEDEGVIPCSFNRFASDEDTDELRYNENTLGRMLWLENLASIHARYPDTVDNDDHLPGAGDGTGEILAYTYGPGIRVVNLDPLGLIGAIRGYEYQTCEHKAWSKSVARAYCMELERAVIRKLIDTTGSNAWTIDSLDDISGDIHASRSEAGNGWTLAFQPGQSAAVSITSMIAKDQRG